MSDNVRLLEVLVKKFSAKEAKIVPTPPGEPSVMVDRGSIRDALDHLKYDRDLSFDMLVDLFCVDYMGEEPRFEVVYILRSTKHNARIVVKTKTGEEGLGTVSDMWPAADFLEREIYDMYGLPFANHPDLRRIYTDDDFVGYPLRKDFPLEGQDFDKPFVVNLEEEKA